MTDSTTPSEPSVDIGSPYTPRKPVPIVSVSINHPLAQAARKIKNFLVHKQTLFSTTFSIKVTPIVAIVSLLGVVTVFGGGITTAYQFGKSVGQKFLAMSITPTPTTSSGSLTQLQPTPSPIPVSKAGTIKATYQNPPTPTTVTATPDVIGGKQSLTNEIASSSTTPRNDGFTPTPTPTPRPVLHYILIEKSESIDYLTSKTVNFQNYLNLRVLVTGSFDSSKNSLEVGKASDIEILQ